MRNGFLKTILIVVGAIFWRFLDITIPKKQRLVLLNTRPDFDDTARALLKAKRTRGFDMVILTYMRKPNIPVFVSDENVPCLYRYSIRGIYSYHRARYIFYTQGLFSFWQPSKRQCVVNLWHGMPIKRIGALHNKKYNRFMKFDFTIANNKAFQRIIADSFNIGTEKVLVVNHPRIDILCDSSHKLDFELPTHRFLAIWLPTFRHSKVDETQRDGSLEGDVFSDRSLLKSVDKFMLKNDVICIVKPHPLAGSYQSKFEGLHSFVYVDENLLLSKDITLYQLLAKSNFLISDVSSVIIDYQITGKPIIIYCPDYDSYRDSRGFNFPIEDLVESGVITDIKDLKHEIGEVISKIESGAKTIKSADMGLVNTEKLFRLLDMRF